jgi:hypothetical protein
VIASFRHRRGDPRPLPSLVVRPTTRHGPASDSRPA